MQWCRVHSDLLLERLLFEIEGKSHRGISRGSGKDPIAVNSLDEKEGAL